MKIECNKCKKEFEKQDIVFEKTIVMIGGRKCQMEYFNCPHCGEEYPVFILSYEDLEIYNEYQKLIRWLKKYQKKAAKDADKVNAKKWKKKYKKYQKIQNVLMSRHKVLSDTYKDGK